MCRVVVLGNAGGGKSTLARQLSVKLQLPLHSMDHLQWRPGWRPAPKDEFIAAHDAILAQSRWLIDGWGNLETVEPRLQASDTIVLLDYPLWRHYAWALERQFFCLFRPRADGPPGCPMLPMTWPLLRMIRWVDREAMPRVRTLVDAYRGQKMIVRIRSLAELRAFCRQVGTQR